MLINVAGVLFSALKVEIAWQVSSDSLLNLLPDSLCYTNVKVLTFSYN